MNFIEMIGAAFKALVELPVKALKGIKKVRSTRSLFKRSITEGGKELKPASGIKRFFKALGRFTLWLLLAAAVIGVFVGLWYVNYKFDLERRLAGPFPLLRQVWLPLLFLVICILVVLGRSLLKLLGPERDVSEYPDIDDAWNEAREALDVAGIDATSVPLFLVLGRPEKSLDTLFAASQMPLTVRQVPRGIHAPLQVYANSQAVYVTCPGTSLLGKQCAILAGEVPGELLEPDQPPQSLFDDMAPDKEPVEKPEQSPVDDPLASQNLLAEVSGQSLLALEEQPAGGVLLEEPAVPAPKQVVRRPALLKKTAEVELLRARLRYLCRVLVRNRRPYCAANGILFLLPFAAADNDEVAAETGTICRYDLTTARMALEVDCPVFALVCDWEKAPGFREFLRQVPEGRRQRLLGQSFPLRPNIETVEVPRMIESGVQWTCQALAALVYKLLRLEFAGQDSIQDVNRANAALYRLVGTLQERQARLCRILSQATVPDAGRPMFFGGCYLAGTGADGASQAFVAGVFRRLVENQNYVTWTAEALAEEHAYQRWTLAGYAGLAVFALAVAVMSYLKLRSMGAEW